MYKTSVELEIENVFCPLCSNNDYINVFTITRFSAPFTIVKCKRCSMTYMNPRFTEKALQQFYNEEYYSGEADYKYYDERENTAMSYLFKGRLNKIKSFQSNGSLLDIGCGFGGFLREAKKKGYDVHGVDVSTFASSIARKEGLDVTTGTLEVANYPDEYFNVVVAVEVFEHFTDPLFELKEIYRILTPGGLLVIQTGNIEGLKAKISGENFDYWLPGHLCYFSRKTIRQALSDSGLKVVKIFFGGEIGLKAELAKNKEEFHGIKRYNSFAMSTFRHVLRNIHFGDFSVVSGMVTYAYKPYP